MRSGRWCVSPRAAFALSGRAKRMIAVCAWRQGTGRTRRATTPATDGIAAQTNPPRAKTCRWMTTTVRRTTSLSKPSRTDTRTSRCRRCSSRCCRCRRSTRPFALLALGRMRGVGGRGGGGLAPNAARVPEPPEHAAPQPIARSAASASATSFPLASIRSSSSPGVRVSTSVFLFGFTALRS